MRFIPLAIALAFTILLQFPLKIGSTSLPALGKFMSPFCGFWQNAEPKDAAPIVPKVESKGFLKAEVNVEYDERLVPHIFAKNLNDAVYAQGYITASLRLWQMEFQTHAAAGRLSEVMGRGANDAVLNFDLQNRRMGMAWSAEKAEAAWRKNPEIWQVMESYTAGVNAYISSLSADKLPLEYKLLGYQPEPWSPLKSILLLKYMSKDLMAYDEDIENSNALNLFGKELFDFLYPEYFAEQSPIIPDSVFKFTAVPLDSLGKKDSGEKLSSSLPKHLPFSSPADANEPPADYVKGSNNWAVHGSKTASGKPILCSDPHLKLSLPSIWFEVQIVTPEHNVYGASLPGAPGVIIGFNNHIAWGVTNVGHDVGDWFAMNWKNGGKDEYMLDSAWVKSEKRIETLKIKGESELIDTLILTKYGPVPNWDEASNKKGMVYQWLGHQPSMDALAFLHLNKATNYDGFQEAMSHYTAPPQNFVYADTAGNISLRVTGGLPLRAKEQGKFVQDGSFSKNYMHGKIPFEHHPQSLNPARGFVSSCNQHSTHPSYPYYYYGGNFEFSRGRRINEALAQLGTDITPDDMKKLQYDALSLKGRDLLPVMLANLDYGRLTNNEKKWQIAVNGWDFQYATQSTNSTLFEKWLANLKELTYDEILGYQEKTKLKMVLPENWQLWKMLRETPEHTIFDQANTPAKETAKDIATTAFQMAVAEIDAWKKDNPGQEPRWTAMQGHQVGHLLPPLLAFGSKQLEIQGDGSCLNAIKSKGSGLGKHTWGPSWRMVVALGNEPEAWVIYPGGQSGNPGSLYYTQMIDFYEAGKHYLAHYVTDRLKLGFKPVASQTFS